MIGQLLGPHRIGERPSVHLLDAVALGLDEEMLRHHARGLTAASDAAFVSRSYRHPYALVAWHSPAVGDASHRVWR